MVLDATISSWGKYNVTVWRGAEGSQSICAGSWILMSSSTCCGNDVAWTLSPALLLARRELRVGGSGVEARVCSVSSEPLSPCVGKELTAGPESRSKPFIGGPGTASGCGGSGVAPASWPLCRLRIGLLMKFVGELQSCTDPGGGTVRSTLAIEPGASTVENATATMA